MNKIEEKLKNKYLTKLNNSDGPSFILSDGSFCLLSFNQKGEWLEKYGDGSTYYSEHLDRLKSDGFTEEEIKWIFNNLPQTNNCRPEEETIVRLPAKNKPNDNQLDSIKIFIDENIMNEGYIKVGVENSNIWQDYILWDNGSHFGLYEENEHIDSDYIITRIINYYKSGRLTESLDKNKIINTIKDNLITTFEVPKGPTYILPDGEFVDLYNSINEENAHEDFICHAEVEYLLKDNDIETINDPYNDGSPTIESIGAIRCNDVEEENNYVLIPKERPYESQLESLFKWLDKNSMKYKYVMVCSNNFESYAKYTYNKVWPEEIIKRIKRYYNKGQLLESKPLTEQLLLELNRGQLINKSKKSDNYKDMSKGKNRWERRNRSHIDNHVAQYNKIDMNKLFKQDELVCGIGVHGETNNYTVTIRYLDVIKEIANQIKLNNNKFEFKCVLIALQRVFNSGNVFVSCTCPDWKYRQAYHATKDGYNSGPIETRASDITNKDDTKGAGCKHVNLVIGNVDWIMKITSVINNYIHYMKDHMERQYADIIFPKLFGIPYQRAIQLNLFDTGDDLNTDSDTIQLSNRYGRDRTRFKSDVRVNNAQGKWTQKEKEEPIDKNQVQLDLNNTEDNEEEPILEK